MHPDYVSAADRLIEECSELIKAVINGKRSGWFKVNPLKVDAPTYVSLLQEAFQDVLHEYGDLLEEIIDETEKFIEQEEDRMKWVQEQSKATHSAMGEGSD